MLDSFPGSLLKTRRSAWEQGYANIFNYYFLVMCMLLKTADFFSLKTCLSATCSLLCNIKSGGEGNVSNEGVAFIACHRKFCFCWLRFLTQAVETACLPSCIGNWIIALRRAVGRKARTEVVVNSCLLAFIATESVSIAISFVALWILPPEVGVNRHGQNFLICGATWA